MKPTASSFKTLTNFYWLARKSGLLDTGLGKRAFSTSYFLYKRYLEDPYHDLITRHAELFRDGNILDIGANIGYTATVFSQAVSAEYKVYAFEPERFNYRLLERSARRSRTRQRIVPIRSAVGDRDGNIDLWENEHHHGDHRIITDHFRQTAALSHPVAVPIMRIDTFVAKQPREFPVRFIKIDVQGYELPVCKGMESTLNMNPRSLVALEYMPSAIRALGFQPEELLLWLRQRNYQVYTLGEGGRLHVGIGNISDDNYCDLLFSRQDLGELT